MWERRPPAVVIHIVAILSIVMAVYFVIISFIQGGLHHYTQPWLSAYPHAAYRVQTCNEIDVIAVAETLAQKGHHSLASACVRIGYVTLVRYEPGTPRVIEVLALEYSPDLLAVVPALATEASEKSVVDPCLHEIDPTVSISGLLGDRPVYAPCDQTGRPLPALIASAELSRSAGIQPGHAVSLLPENFIFKKLQPFVQSQPDSGRLDHAVVRIIGSKLPILENVVLVPTGTLGKLDLGYWVIFRLNGIDSLARLTEAMEVLDRKVRQSPEAIPQFLISQAEVWGAEQTTRNLMQAIHTVSVLMVLVVAVLAVSQYIQRERRAFAIYRISGFSNAAIALVVQITIVLSLAVSGAIGIVLGQIGSLVITTLWLPGLPYGLNTASLGETALATVILSGLSSWLVVWNYFSHDLAKEFQDVHDSA